MAGKHKYMAVVKQPTKKLRVKRPDAITHAGRRRRAVSQRRANQVALHQAGKDRRKQSIGDVLAGAPVKLARLGEAEIARRKVRR